MVKTLFEKYLIYVSAIKLTKSQSCDSFILKLSGRDRLSRRPGRRAPEPGHRREPGHGVPSRVADRGEDGRGREEGGALHSPARPAPHLHAAAHCQVSRHQLRHLQPVHGQVPEGPPQLRLQEPEEVAAAVPREQRGQIRSSS